MIPHYSVVSWCACHGITKANYHYRLLQQQEQKGSNVQAGLDIPQRDFFVHVTEATPKPLLAAVLEVIYEYKELNR